MTNSTNSRPDLSSPFDAMLAQNKKRFDDLYVRRRPGEAFAAALTGGGHGRAPVAGQPTVASAGLDPDSPVMHQLNERFGGDWRYEITEQRRDGDEAIVLCRLIVGKEGAVRTQFGRAKIGQSSVAGASGGLRFKLGASGEAEEDAAFRRAIEAGLINCADLL